MRRHVGGVVAPVTLDCPESDVPSALTRRALGPLAKTLVSVERLEHGSTSRGGLSGVQELVGSPNAHMLSLLLSVSPVRICAACRWEDHKQKTSKFASTMSEREWHSGRVPHNRTQASQAPSLGLRRHSRRTFCIQY